MTMPSILLIVENNNLNQANSLASHLTLEESQLVQAHTIETAKEQTSLLWPNLILLHLHQWDIDVLQLQQTLNQLNLNLPWVIVGEESQSLISSNAHVSWVTPNNVSQLNEVVVQALDKQANRFVRFRQIVLDCQNREVLQRETSHSLTPKEFRLLHLLLTRPDQILTRKEIMQHVWQTDYMGDTRTLDVHVRWLRKKIEDNPARPDYLKTVRGEGYIFVTRSLRQPRETAAAVPTEPVE